MKLTVFIRQHDNWEEILTSDPYNILVVRDCGFILLKYNQLSSDFNEQIVRECRGIILREGDYKVVCHPFDKFGNYGESYCPDIDWKTASVQEKVDGSLIKLWYDEIGETWRISTNGTISAFKAELENNISFRTFGELFVFALPVKNCADNISFFFDSLDKNMTYMFELVSPYNRVVIPYKVPEVYFLGARNNATQQEYMPEDTDLGRRNIFKIPKRYNLSSLKDVEAAARDLPWDKEGYVVCDANFNRVKIKSTKWIEAHYARSNNMVPPHKMLDIYRQGEKEEFLIYADDMREIFEKIENAYEKFIDMVIDKIDDVYTRHNFESRKDLANYVLKMPKYMQRFVFNKENLEKQSRTPNPENLLNI